MMKFRDGYPYPVSPDVQYGIRRNDIFEECSEKGDEKLRNFEKRSKKQVVKNFT